MISVTTVFIPTDGSELSRRAVQHGLELAKAVGAKATALTVEGLFDVYTVPASRVYEMSGAFAEHAARARAPARSTINPGVGVILAALAPDDEEIRRARFAQEQLAERFKGAPPLDALERAAPGAKRLASLIETRRHLLKIVLVGFGQPDIPSHERRPQRVPRNPDKGGLEAVGQADRQFNPPLRIMLDVDVDHQR